MPEVNPIDRFGAIPSTNPTYGHILAEKIGKWEFQLYPQLWDHSELNKIKGLRWHRIQFLEKDDMQLDTIPVGSGVYFFTVEGRTDLLSCHTYLFYAGKAPSGLRSRVRDYLEEREGTEPDSDRKKITEFLNYFRGHVYFNYTETAKNDAPSIESAIKDNFTPPANTILKLKGRLYS